MRAAFCTLLCAALALQAGARAAPAGGDDAGIVIEKVTRGSAADRAGVRTGDILIRWELQDGRAPASGSFATPFDLPPIQQLQQPGGRVLVHGSRDGQSLDLALLTPDWDVESRPRFAGSTLEGYLAAAGASDAASRSAAAQKLQEISAERRAGGDVPQAAWLQLRAAMMLGDAGRWEEAQQAIDAGAAGARTQGFPDLEGLFLIDAGDYCLRQSRYDMAARIFQVAIDLEQRRDPGSMACARAINYLGRVEQRRGNPAAAREQFDRARVINEQLAPGSLAVAASLNNLAIVAWDQGELEAATRDFQRALEIRQQKTPESLMVAMTLNNLANVDFDRGDLDRSDERNRQALALRERLAPGSLDVAASLNSLGGVASERGDQAAAGDYFKQALEIRERLAPGSLLAATTLHNLGRHARIRRDFGLARDYLGRALQIREKLAPGGRVVANTLLELGILADLEKQDLAAARQYFQRYLEIQQRDAPDSLNVAMGMNALGACAQHGNDLVAAESWYRRSLEIRQRLAPGSLDVASSLGNLGSVAARRGDLAQAAEAHQRALAIRKQLAPGSMEVADSAADLGRVLRRSGRLQEAAVHMTEAVDALESQQEILGGVAEDRIAFRANTMDVYRDAIDLMVELRRDADALALLERSRARELLLMLSEKRALLAGDVPAELEKERRQAAAAYDRTQAQLSALAPDKDGARMGELQHEMESLRRRQGEIHEQMRRASPRVAALKRPEPLDFAGVRRALDPGTVLLAYSVAESSSRLFVIDADGGLRVAGLPAGRERLETMVRELRASIAAEAKDGAPSAADTTRKQCALLYETLVAPAGKALDNAQRLLIVPDGPLHTLPFALLARPEGRGYLIEWKPLHTTASVTIYDQIRRTRRSQVAHDGPAMVAFGDPAMPEPAGPEPGVAAASPAAAAAAPPRPAWRDALKPLVGAREEVESIAQLYGPSARTLMGAEATEQAAKRTGTGPRLIHFATHAIVDETTPLDSAIVLSLQTPADRSQDNGLLQAWEIFEGMHLDADLVTLSACDTALGKEAGGEGMIGLTRAFQYAGARSVVASLWNVSDRSTADLMTRFYSHLRQGMPKDEALRAAQIAMIRGSAPARPEEAGDERGVSGLAKSHPSPGNHAAPWYWAAFQLVGDWM